MAKVHHYLNFDGQAENAFNFYKSVFGGEFRSFMRYQDMPSPEKIPDEIGNRILHVVLPISKHFVLMGADVHDDYGSAINRGNNSFILLAADSSEEALRLYKGLSEGGEVEMPMEETYWSQLYSSFKDKYGICWMINYDGSKLDRWGQ
ncbi:VOC family protein [Sphingobacterium spiritivorum]|uniref:Glyoxalase family protein n=1 Tax=Sphingobacterium spiritivorum ATCC 33861 TaxID=525373 RepID=D7VRA3_SPHSI|nr:VOC family protein [Sphingobacterium spiritivorum]EFK56304.1 glyoxalase family protein [Sphingobacterium spiritivorum ATCC 33861]QQT35608.1 VOC family protein [Sphingobacterium spiritivorum]WQD32308.1 VOC family protein [Sphingobacterium spiritivorum]SUJ07798.1 Uncharacterized protein conserved in bacteria [Sphingobacterium spiritivorum]